MLIWACFCAELGFSVKLKQRGAASVCTELNSNQKKFICNEHSMRSKTIIVNNNKSVKININL